MKKRNLLMLCAAVILLGALFSGCVPGDGASSPDDPAGFFFGVWHGWIAPFSLIYSIFNKNIGIYEINNSGILYDFGFYIAVISGFGSLALSRKKKKAKTAQNDIG